MRNSIALDPQPWSIQAQQDSESLTSKQRQGSLSEARPAVQQGRHSPSRSGRSREPAGSGLQHLLAQLRRAVRQGSDRCAPARASFAAQRQVCASACASCAAL